MKESHTMPPPITPVEMSERDIELAESAAKRLGYSQTAYTSTSGLWGLFCLPDHAKHREGCFIKTKEFGLMFVADLEDLQLHDLADEERRQPRKDAQDADLDLILTNSSS